MAKRATAREVAERAGVSRTTVSFVLNNVPGIRISEETRQSVLAAARELDYHPDATARSMVTGKTHIIGFVLRQDLDQAFADRFVPTVLIGISAAASEQNYKVLFEPIPLEDTSGGYTRLLRERYVDGIVLSGPRFDDQELLRAHQQGAPVVLLGQLPGSGLPFVDVNNRGGAQKATEHLLKLGHRRLALITNADPIYTASADRLAGYRQALQDAGLPYRSELVRHGDFTPQSGAAAMEALLDLAPPPTAVFIASDTVALGALQTLRRRKLRVPDDLAIVGFDDIPLSEFIDPPLTTVSQPSYTMGRLAFDLLAAQIGGPASGRRPAEDVTLKPTLIIRSSCGNKESS